MGKMAFWRGERIGPAPAFEARPGSAEALLLMESFEESRQGWFWSTDAFGCLSYLSAGIGEALGARGSPIGARFADLFVSADEEESARGKLGFLMARQSAFEKIMVQAAAGGDETCWSVSGRPVFDPSGDFAGFRGSALDITEARRSSRDADQLARYDALTGLPNRRSMARSLASALLAGPAPACTLILIGLDRFKQVNDTLGHPAGDALLKQVAERLLRIVGDRENVFRLGGDEFQIISRSTDRGVSGGIADEIIASLSQPYSIDGQRCIIGASIGIASAPADGSTPEELIRNADLALYAAKSGGRGRFRFFTGELLEAAEDKRLLEEDLRDALARGQIHLSYQPVVESRSNAVKGVEALIRWTHPERGEIPPSLFIPIAEEADLIGQLGEWALRHACEEAAGWPTRLRVAVNVSPLQFANEAFPSCVKSALEESGLAPDQLELEITEGVFLADSAETDTMFSALKELGVRLALDDFGTGYSSLSYLRTAPFDKIKIDQTFVREATLPGSRNGAIIAAIVALADALDMETTAEGIEYMDQLDLIRGLGVSHVQGYVYSRPISGEEVRKRIERGDWRIEPRGPAKQRSERQAMLRKAGLMHGSVYETVLVRNLSETGALIEGLHGMAKGDLCILDFGDGQLAYARVKRTAGRNQGVEFEDRLVSDGNDGLCTPHRVSPYLLATMGLPAIGSSDQPIEVGPALLPLEELGQRLGLAAAAPASASAPPAAKAGGLGRRHEREGHLTHEEARRLIGAALASPNRQLKYIVALLMVTGVKPGELLRARWSQIDLETRLWHIPVPRGGKARELALGPAAIELLGAVPRWDDCPHLIVNPTTRKPYRTLDRSWEAVRVKAGLPFTELDDLRYCPFEAILSSPELLEVVHGPAARPEEPDFVDVLTPRPAPGEGETEPASEPEWVDVMPARAVPGGEETAPVETVEWGDLLRPPPALEDGAGEAAAEPGQDEMPPSAPAMEADEPAPIEQPGHWLLGGGGLG